MFRAEPRLAEKVHRFNTPLYVPVSQVRVLRKILIGDQRAFLSLTSL